MKNYLLIISCSQRKLDTPERIYAMYRYDGPTYQILHKLRREGHFPLDLDVLIISARYGLVGLREPIHTYNQKMTAERADELRPYVQESLRKVIGCQQYQQVFMNLGKTYMLTLGGFDWGSTSTLEATGGIGQKNSQMKAWLEQIYNDENGNL